MESGYNYKYTDTRNNNELNFKPTDVCKKYIYVAETPLLGLYLRETTLEKHS